MPRLARVGGRPNPAPRRPAPTRRAPQGGGQRQGQRHRVLHTRLPGLEQRAASLAGGYTAPSTFDVWQRLRSLEDRLAQIDAQPAPDAASAGPMERATQIDQRLTAAGV